MRRGVSIARIGESCGEQTAMPDRFSESDSIEHRFLILSPMGGILLLSKYQRDAPADFNQSKYFSLKKYTYAIALS